MTTSILVLFSALCAQAVHSSHYQGPVALPVVLHNGYLADTHEVAAAKSAHLATLALQSQGHVYGGDDNYGYSPNGGLGHQGHYKYNGPVAIPNVLHNGHIADTHEVAAAKAAHFAAVAKAKHHGGYDHSSYSGVNHVPYHGPIAIPHVLHNGHIADTHEVAAAKSAHFAAVAKAKGHGGYSGQYAGGYDHGSYSGAHHLPYHGPLFKPVVLKSGYLADTHEVAAAKQRHLYALHSSLSGHQYGVGLY